MDIFIEDQVSKKGPIGVTTKPSTKVYDFKNKILLEHDIPTHLQELTIKDQIINLQDDNEPLSKFGICQTKDVILIKISPNENNDCDLSGSENDISEDYDDAMNETDDILEGAAGIAPQLILPIIEKPEQTQPPKHLQNKEENKFGTIKIGWTCTLCTLINEPSNHHCVACTQRRPNDYKPPKEVQIDKNAPTFINNPSHISDGKNDLNKSQNQNRKSTEIFNIKIEETPKMDEKIHPSKIPIMNRPSHTSIVMTVLSNPNITRNKYRGVDNYNPRYTPLKALELPKPTVKIAPPAKPLKTHRIIADHYHELLSLDTADLILNFDPFECPICFLQFKKGEGIILRDCFHVFCRECLEQTVKFSDDIQIKCPFMNAEMSCESLIQDREMRSFVSRDVYEKHLAKSVQQAEHGIENTFHCKTHNCRGWCIYEDNVNQFKCPVCQIINCLTCQVKTIQNIFFFVFQCSKSLYSHYFCP